jgi:plasmid stability protein
MDIITIRSVDDSMMQRLRERAVANGRSIEAEVHPILLDALPAPGGEGVGSRIAARFGRVRGVDLDLPDRSEAARAADLG